MQAVRLLLVLVLLVITVNSKSSVSRRPLLRKPASSQKTGCYIIVIKKKATQEQVDELLARVVKASDGHKMYGMVRKATRAFSVKLSPYSLEMVRGLPAVDYIEEEGFATGDLSGDILQWHLDRLDQTGYPLDLSYAPVGDGEGVDIYILDSGINYDHEEFEYRAKYAGYDPVDEFSLANDVQDDYQRQFGRDCHGHGTHVASLSAGKTYGTAKRATVYSVRVLNCNNAAPWMVVLDGLDYVSQVVEDMRRPSIVSMSLSGDFYRSLNEAVASLEAQGVHVVVAAGNGGRDACTKSPASSSSAITVGGSKNGDGFYLLGAGSNFGSCVDVFAPGENILAADWQCSNCCKTLSGTSMATPLVSGVVAVYLSKQPLISPLDMKRRLVSESLSGVLSLDGVPLPYHSSTPNKLINMLGSCGGSNFPLSYVPLSSPGYPQSYPPNLDCVWQLEVGAGHEVVVNISSVSLEDHYDVLRLYGGKCCDNLVAQFTGDLGSVGYTYTSVGGLVSLRLLTDGSGSSTGFAGSLTKVYTGTNIRVPDPDIEIPTSLLVRRPVHVVSLRGLSSKRARDAVTDHLTRGYKVIWITAHRGGAVQSHAVDIVLTNSTLVDSRVFIDLTAEELNQTLQRMAQEGYSIRSLADRERGLSPNSHVSYLALFHRTNHLLETKVFLNDSLDEWRTRVDQLNKTGHRLISQCFVEYNGRTQVATVFTLDRRLAHNITFDPPPKMIGFTNVTFFEFTGFTLDYARKNYYLTHLEVHQLAGEPSSRFNAIMVAHNEKTVREGQWFRWGLDEEAVRSMIETEASSWDPYVVSGYSHQGALRYYVGFRRHARQ